MTVLLLSWEINLKALERFQEKRKLMKRIILILMTLAINCTSAYATTAVLCGDSSKVDQNNDLASVWLILDNENSRSPDEIKVMFKGKETEVVNVNDQSEKIYIHFAKPEKTLVLEAKSIESSSCDGESQFSVRIQSKSASKTINDCRCFAD